LVRIPVSENPVYQAQSGSGRGSLSNTPSHDLN
jgi:hypothetical protein